MHVYILEDESGPPFFEVRLDPLWTWRECRVVEVVKFIWSTHVEQALVRVSFTELDELTSSKLFVVSNVLRYLLSASWVKLWFKSELKVPGIFTVRNDKSMVSNYVVVYKSLVVYYCNVWMLTVNDMLKCCINNITECACMVILAHVVTCNVLVYIC